MKYGKKILYVEKYKDGRMTISLLENLEESWKREVKSWIQNGTTPSMKFLGKEGATCEEIIEWFEEQREDWKNNFNGKTYVWLYYCK